MRHKGLRLLFAAAVTLGLGAAALGERAGAQERRGYGRAERAYGGGRERYGPPPGAGRGGAYGPVPYGGYGPRGYPATPYGAAPQRGGPYPDYGGRAYPLARGPGFGASPGFRRGQILPPAYLGGAAPDPRAYRLRRAPSGFGWVIVGPNAYLVQQSSGMILDTAPLY